MICLEKLQKELAEFLHIDRASLPSVQNVLREKGYTSILKGKQRMELNPKTQEIYKLDVTQKEQRGIYNVIYNGKNATLIRQDLESVENAIRFEKGRENPKTNKGYGAKHILKHTTNPNAQGYITDLELVNMGNSMREYLKKHKEPFIDKNGARIYEWEKDKVRFRLVVNHTKGEGNSNLPQLSKPLSSGKNPSTTEGAKALFLPSLGGGTRGRAPSGTQALHAHPSNERIITFYSDRNLKESMVFKNPAVEKGEKFRFVDDLKAHSAQIRTAQPLNDGMITYFSNQNATFKEAGNASARVNASGAQKEGAKEANAKVLEGARQSFGNGNAEVLEGASASKGAKQETFKEAENARVNAGSASARVENASKGANANRVNARVNATFKEASSAKNASNAKNASDGAKQTQANASSAKVLEGANASDAKANALLYKLQEDFNNPNIFKKAFEATLEKTLGNASLKDTWNKLGFNTASNKEYMHLRQKVLEDTNGSLKAVVDLNNLLNAKFSKQELIEMQRYFVGDVYEEKILTKEMQAIADVFSEKISALTKLGVERGVFPEYYKEFKGYLKRSYKKHLFNKNGKLKSSALEFHKVFHRGTSEFVSPKKLKEMLKNGEMAVTLDDYKAGKWVISENTNKKGYVEIYRDWTKQEREKMGEIEDFSFNVARTLETMQKQLYTHDFIKAMEAKGVIYKLEKNKNLEGYVEFAKEYGIIGNPFRGYAVKAEVASDLKDTFYKLYGDFIPFANEYKTSIALWKSFKTIWNPTSHLNNILGNATFLLASGEYKASGRLLKNIFAGPSIFKHYKRYKELALRERNFKDLNTKEKQELKRLSTQENALLETLESKGYFDKSFLNSIVENYHAKHNGIQKQKEWALKRFHNKLGNVYNAEDVLARMSLAQSLLEQGLKLEDALKKTSEILPDYSKPIPYWIKNLDRYGVMPFVQFLYHATPIMARQINPMRIKSDKQVLINFLTLGAYFAYAKLITPLPDGYFGQELVYDSSDEEAVRTIRVGSIIPHLQLLEFLPFSGNGKHNLGEWNALPEIVRKSAVGAVPWQAAGLMQNHNYTFDRPITRRDGVEGALDRAVAVADFALPAPIGKGANALLNLTTKDAQNKKSKIHNERNPYEEALGFFGLNLKSFNARELEKKRQRDALKKAREGV